MLGPTLKTNLSLAFGNVREVTPLRLQRECAVACTRLGTAR